MQQRDLSQIYFLQGIDPNPIPSGGRARVQIRGRLISEKVYSGTGKKIDINYEAGEDVFVIVPYGFAVTYCNTPIVVYEKNARTVCSFKAGALSIRAKDVKTEKVAKLGPTISRDTLSKPIISTIPISVVACEIKAVLDAAPTKLSGSVPVIFKGLQDNFLTPEQAVRLKPGETLIWKVSNSVINGLEGFRALVGGLKIGGTVTLELAEVDPNKGLVTTGSVVVPVRAAK